MEDENYTPPTLRNFNADLAFPPRESRVDADSDDGSFFNISATSGKADASNAPNDVALFSEEPMSQATDEPIDSQLMREASGDRSQPDELSSSLVQSLRDESPRRVMPADEDGIVELKLDDARDEERPAESRVDADETEREPEREPSKPQSKSIPIPMPTAFSAARFASSGDLKFTPEPYEEKGSSLSDETLLASRHSKYHIFQLKIHKFILRSLKSCASVAGKKREQELNVLFNYLVGSITTKLKGQLPECQTLDYYYEIVAQLYFDYPERANAIVLLGKDHFWDNYQFGAITSALFFKLLFVNCETMKQVMLFVKGSYKLFMLDSQKLTSAFKPIHEHLRGEVLMRGAWIPRTITLYLLEIFDLCSGFYFYYNPNCSRESLETFIAETTAVFKRAEVRGPANHAKIHVLNMFANEIMRQIPTFRQERVIVTYLKCCQLFTGSLEIPGRKTHLRLHILLLDERTPGSPFYPTRPIREAAQEALDMLYPAGKISRSLLGYGFRLLHPLELYRSISYWALHPKEFALSIVYWWRSWLSYIVLFFYSLYRFLLRKIFG